MFATMLDPDLMTPDETAEMLGLGRTSLGLLRREGLPVVVIGHRTIRYQRGPVIEWLRARSERQQAERAAT